MFAVPAPDAEVLNGLGSTALTHAPPSAVGITHAPAFGLAMDQEDDGDGEFGFDVSLALGGPAMGTCASPTHATASGMAGDMDSRGSFLCRVELDGPSLPPPPVLMPEKLALPLPLCCSRDDQPLHA
ncbi:hypothetical protein AMAG_19933 [Allomyces macrogynus ATCC 38327]|uniref:Uncharacterized protein n=1 Tax=Allomyces macrogynus (strain ATCC 38327) TaxID=578462 RepID=A0A0L0T4F2_ALLM3|nr:hypothetical protein AMAG_19933 [Allomyces macrogynus ATCC 38327]|eukprot:KNE69439.1 hypothetical protein AMAG_19933 [Allomyces macrogynus ATCC 38327]